MSGRALAAWMVFWLLCPAWLAAQEAPATSAVSQQQITDLDLLLQSVRQEQRRQRELNRQREQDFLRDRDRQRDLLAQARRDFQRRQQENQPLLAVTERNREEIARLEKNLQEVVQDMGDLASTFREFAGDFGAVLRESMISAQLPQRGSALDRLADVEGQPTIDDIQELWLLLLEEMTEAGRISLFQAPVVAGDGTGRPRDILRVGMFSAYAGRDFLRYVPETGELLVLSRQPPGRLRAAAADFATADGIAEITVDPTRGSLLGMLSYTPSLRERIDQGGTIALIIICLGTLGILLTLWRGLYLSFVWMRMRSQLAQVERPRPDNPLGRVLAAVEGLPLEQEELLQLKLDEAVLAEMPALERGNGLIKLLAATSPLLGLLGTVTGMILTFQAISLFGTGDPKLMAGGISQALVTTVLGLVVAIPLLFGHSVIAYMARSMVQRLDEQCAGVLARSAESQEPH